MSCEAVTLDSVSKNRVIPEVLAEVDRVLSCYWNPEVECGDFCYGGTEP